jgi:hypothetical protein
LFDKKWDDERHGIFEPIPIKSDLESKGRLYDAQEDRPDADGEDDEDDSGIPRVETGASSSIPSVAPSGNINEGKMIDLDDLLGGLSGS